jgi:hypothetical protein
MQNYDETLYLYTKLRNMSADNNSDHDYFDESTSILAPVYMLIALLVIFLTLFLG